VLILLLEPSWLYVAVGLHRRLAVTPGAPRPWCGMSRSRAHATSSSLCILGFLCIP